jgi:hypothetical protein
MWTADEGRESTFPAAVGYHQVKILNTSNDPREHDSALLVGPNVEDRASWGRGPRVPSTGLARRIASRCHAWNNAHLEGLLLDDHMGTVKDGVERRGTKWKPPNEAYVAIS